MTMSLHRRPGVTTEQLQEKRARLLSVLNSPEHKRSIVTRDYGSHDPRIAPLPPCVCGAPAELAMLENGRWEVCCTGRGCGKKIRDPQLHDWAACLDWCQLNLDSLNYQELPLFGLKGLDRAAAKVRLVSIYDDLLIRSQIATLDVSLSERTHQHAAPGRDYIEKLHAYRDWARLGLRILKSGATSPQVEVKQSEVRDLNNAVRPFMYVTILIILALAVFVLSTKGLHFP
jgi:hypothetical protein